LGVIKQLPDKEKSVKLFSHLIHAQDKWYNRITKQADDSSIAWMGSAFLLDELELKWKESVRNWIELIDCKNETDLQKDVVFSRASDDKQMGIKLVDLCLQLNYHSIHHRAQINTLISQQGLTPPATDYIFTKLKEI
jgi:uncharacterized damage-inducible protein DinB